MDPNQQESFIYGWTFSQLSTKVNSIQQSQMDQQGRRLNKLNRDISKFKMESMLLRIDGIDAFLTKMKGEYTNQSATYDEKNKIFHAMFNELKLVNQEMQELTRPPNCFQQTQKFNSIVNRLNRTSVNTYNYWQYLIIGEGYRNTEREGGRNQNTQRATSGQISRFRHADNEQRNNINRVRSQERFPPNNITNNQRQIYYPQPIVASELSFKEIFLKSDELYRRALKLGYQQRDQTRLNDGYEKIDYKINRLATKFSEKIRVYGQKRRSSVAQVERYDYHNFSGQARTTIHSVKQKLIEIKRKIDMNQI